MLKQSKEVKKAPVIKEVIQVKKRGRPSKEEVLLREKQKLERENQLKDQIIQAQTGSMALAATGVTKDPVASQKIQEFQNILPPGVTFGIPIFKVGEYVKEMIFINGRRIYKGMVLRQDIDSRFVFVSWKDGSKQWHGAQGLQKISREEYRKRDETASVTEIEVDEETLDGMEDINGIGPT